MHHHSQQQVHRLSRARAGQKCRLCICSREATKTKFGGMSDGMADQMGSDTSAEVPPTNISNFDPSLLSMDLHITAIRIRAQKISSALKELKDHLLNKPRQPNVVESTESTEAPNREKIVMLSEEIKAATVEELPEKVREFVKAAEGTLVQHTLKMGYEQFTYEDVLRKVLPTGVDVPSSFETVGHIAHLNLKDQHEPYKLTIARVMRDKYPAIKTVVNKVGTIQNTFRVFSMEVLADATGGPVPRIAQPQDKALETSVRQHGSTFKMNFGEVYWNSRLEAEHKRLVETFKSGDEVWDMFAGIGPFAVPASRSQGCLVHANDLNPRSCHYLRENVRANKCEGVTCYNQDARAFLRARVSSCGRQPPAQRVHCVMNLPATAPEFVDVFKGAFETSVWKGRLPHVHLYAFSKNACPKACAADILERVRARLGVVPPGATAHEVRDVAPKKLMMCISFPLPEDVCLKEGALEVLQHMEEEEEGKERDAKRAKLDEEDED